MIPPSFTSIFSFIFMASLCNMMVTGSPTAVEDRQSRQMFFTPQYNFPSYSPLFFYNPYGGMIEKPAEVDLEEDRNSQYIIAPSSAGDSAFEAADGSRGPKANILIIPRINECLVSNFATDGGVRCRVTTDVKSGSIDIRLGLNGQTANVAIQAPTSTTKIRLFCSEIIAASVFTQTGQINAPSDTPRTELGSMSLAVTSTGDNARVRCRWIRKM